MPAAHIAPQTAEPAQALIAAGRMPASSNARATPTMAIPAPLPPDPTTPIRLPWSAGTGRCSSGGNTCGSIALGRSTSGSGSSASRALTRNATSEAALADARQRAQPRELAPHVERVESLERHRRP